MQSTSWETLGWKEAQAGIKIAGRNINNLTYADDTTLMAESEEELKSLLVKVKHESGKAGLKINIQKNNNKFPDCPVTLSPFCIFKNTSQIDLDNIPTDYSTFRSLGKSVWQLSLPVLKYQSQKPESIWTCYVV